MIKQSMLEPNETDFIGIGFNEFDTVLPNFSKYARNLIPDYGSKRSVVRFRSIHLKGICCRIPSVALNRISERCEKYLTRRNPDRKPIKVLADTGKFIYTILDIHFLRMYNIALIKKRIDLIGSI
ncbi:hypothetical protein [Proteus mirabilis]|uniref:hypothetical protein n=1 Tax=Proteus mirabilis TaxID=584 RepID=UPI0034D3A5A7